MYNAIAAAKTPVMDSLWAAYPQSNCHPHLEGQLGYQKVKWAAQ